MFYSKNKELCITNEELCIKNDELCRGRHHGRNFAWCDFSIDFQLFLDCILKVFRLFFDRFATDLGQFWVNFDAQLRSAARALANIACAARHGTWQGE